MMEKSWNKINKFGSNDSNEATLCNISKNRVLAAVRTHNDHHVKLCETSTSGKWKEKGPLTLPMQHPADLTKLSENCVLLTYGIRNRGLMGIGARLSVDVGKTWKPLGLSISLVMRPRILAILRLLHLIKKEPC